MHMDPELLAASSQGARLQLPPLEVVRRTLPNGLEIIVQEDHSAPVVSVQIWVQTGSIHEGKAMGAGISHMLEHMLFKGTTTLSACEFAQRVQDQGGYINAYTSFDRTVYWIDIPAKGADVALDLLADAALHSTLPPEEFLKEQEVIRREFAMGNDDPDRVSSTALFANAFREHPYRYPIIGHLDVFNTITRDDVMAYYKARYVPNNMFFVVTGDVEAAAVHRRLESLFAATPRAPLPPVFLPEEPRAARPARAPRGVPHGADPPPHGVARPRHRACRCPGARCARDDRRAWPLGAALPFHPRREGARALGRRVVLRARAGGALRGRCACAIRSSARRSRPRCSAFCRKSSTPA